MYVCFVVEKENLSTSPCPQTDSLAVFVPRLPIVVVVIIVPEDHSLTHSLAPCIPQPGSSSSSRRKYATGSKWIPTPPSYTPSYTNAKTNAKVK